MSTQAFTRVIGFSLQGRLPSLTVNLFLQDKTLRSMQHDQTVDGEGEKKRAEEKLSNFFHCD